MSREVSRVSPIQSQPADLTLVCLCGCACVDLDNSCSNSFVFKYAALSGLDEMRGGKKANLDRGIESLNLQVPGGHCLATRGDCTLLLLLLADPS